MNKKTLLLCGANVPERPPESIDFDGANDYLFRSSDLIANINSRAFTFGCWFYKVGNSVQCLSMGTQSVSHKFEVLIGDNGYINLQGRNSSRYVLDAYTSAGLIYDDRWYNLTLSIDLSNISNRHVYLDDVDITNSFTFQTYYNSEINFAAPAPTFHQIANNIARNNPSKCRLSNLFLDYTYRDLFLLANRRKFITFDAEKGLVPADRQAALNPIIYLPFDDPATSHVNAGTGGNFVQNGTISRSNRSQNEYNSNALTLGGSNSQRLSRGSMGVSDGKQITLSVSFKYNSIGNGEAILFFYNAAAYNNQIVILMPSPGSLDIKCKSAAGGTIVRFGGTCNLVDRPGRLIHMSLSADTSTGTAHIIIDGLEGSSHFSATPTPIDTNIPFSLLDTLNVGKSDTSNYVEADIGEIYMDNSYIDLSTRNPFWDSRSNKPKYLGESGELPTGLSPLIYLPLRANAGNNLGTGDNFIVNNGPFTGARGGSEYWARSAVVDGSKYLTGSVVCASLIKWRSTDNGETWTINYDNSVTVTNIGNGTDNGVVAYYFGTSEIINWSIEANKLRFTDGLGYPVPPVLDSQTVLFLDFSNLSNFGLNKGSGGNFTQTGTIIAGADVNV